MSRPALSAQRSIAILSFLAANPARAFSMSEIAGSTDMSVSTCHAILGLLESEGMLVRHPRHKTYRLGAALAAIGEAAATFDPLLIGAREAVVEIARRTGFETVLAARAGMDVIGVARVANQPLARVNLRVGQRIPLRPPVGGLFVAWGTDDDVARWLAPEGANTSDEMRNRHERDLNIVRNRGFHAGIHHKSRIVLADLVAQQANRVLGQADLDAFMRSVDNDSYELDPIVAGESYEINNVAVPIFDEMGRVVFQLGVNLMRESVSGEDIMQLVHLMRELSGAVTFNVQSDSRYKSKM